MSGGGFAARGTAWLSNSLLPPESAIFALQLRLETMRHERIDGVRPSAVWSHWLLLSERWARLGRLLGIAAWIVGFGRSLADLARPEPAPVAILRRS